MRNCFSLEHQSLQVDRQSVRLGDASSDLAGTQKGMDVKTMVHASLARSTARSVVIIRASHRENWVDKGCELAAHEVRIGQRLGTSARKALVSKTTRPAINFPSRTVFHSLIRIEPAVAGVSSWTSYIVETSS